MLFGSFWRKVNFSSILPLLKNKVSPLSKYSTNQNPRIEWQHEAPPLDSWVYCRDVISKRKGKKY
jgi:hypothetical protein